MHIDSAKLRELRLACGYTISDLSQASGVRPGTLKSCEDGSNNRGLTLKMLDGLAEALGTTVDDLADPEVTARMILKKAHAGDATYLRQSQTVSGVEGDIFDAVEQILDRRDCPDDFPKRFLESVVVLCRKYPPPDAEDPEGW